MNSKQSRISLICQIIETEKVRSQNDIISKLSEKGQFVTQASLSRYLKEIKASRVPDGQGGYIYTLPNSINKPTTVLANEVISVEFAGNIVVLKTIPGYANAVTALIDSKDLNPIAGTVSGDDTIIIVIRDGFTRKQIKQILLSELPYIKDKIINE